MSKSLSLNKPVKDGIISESEIKVIAANHGKKYSKTNWLYGKHSKECEPDLIALIASRTAANSEPLIVPDAVAVEAVEADTVDVIAVSGAILANDVVESVAVVADNNLELVAAGLASVVDIKSALSTAKLNKKHPPVKHAEAERFLNLLDEGEEQFTFQTFDDDQVRKDPSLTKILIGTYEQHAPQLTELNMRGAGIFVTVNRTSGNGRTIADMLEPRVIFNEDDCGNSPSPAGLEPHIVVVSSPGKKHDYYLIDGATAADWPTWDGCQLAMALDFGSDKNAVDRTRVLRLPGYYHQKDPKKPHLVYIRSTSGEQPYTMAQIAQCVPPKPPKAIQRPAVPGNSEHLPEIESALEFIDPDCIYDDWLQVGMAVHHESNGGSNGFELWEKWSSGDLSADHHGVKYPAKNPDLLICKWNSFNSNGNKTGAKTRASIFKRAQDAGWLNPKKKQSSSNAEPPPRHEKPGVEQSAGDTHNHTLDNESKYCKVDLVQYVAEKHLLKRMAIQIAAQTHLPVNTVFMMGLSVYASMSCRSFAVLYPNGRSLPIGINLVDEQPPGTGKSWCLSDFQEPFMQIFFQISEDFKRRISLLQKKGDSKTDEETDELKSLQSKRYPPFITNTTSAGLDITLPSTNGFFSCVSSEQGLLDTLLGISYNTGSNDNDIILNGFDAGFVGSSRAGREPYNGVVVGSVVCFAQEGSIEKILGQSNGTGLAERFLFLSEQHMLGTRDHTHVVESNDALMVEYAAACSFAIDVLETPKHYKDITNITISKRGHYAIALYRNEIEPHLADGGKFSHISLRGAASKCNMQIMKIAANLHLLDGGSSQSEIADHHVESAIQIANELLEANLALCVDKGIIGVRAEFKSILSLFENSSNARTERNILSVKRKSLPFKDFTGDKANLIRKTLAEMVDQRLLFKHTKEGKVMYEPAQ